MIRERVKLVENPSKCLNTIQSMFNKFLSEEKMQGRFVVYLSIPLLFVISFFYLYWINRDIFFIQENKSLFIYSREYLQKFTDKPGGLLEYAGNFLIQFYYSPVYGSLIVSSVIALICVFFVKIYKELTDKRSFSLLYILLPAYLLLLSQKSYDHFMCHNLGYLLVTIFFLISIVSERNRSTIIFLAMIPVFIYLAGSFIFIYLGMYISYWVFNKKGIQRYLLPFFMIVITLFVFVIFKEVLFLQPVDKLIFYPLNVIEHYSYNIYFYLLYGYIVSCPVLILLSGSFRKNPKSVKAFSIISLTAIFLITVFLLFRHKNPDLTSLYRLEKLLYMQDWDSIICQHESYPARNIEGQYYYNLALSNRGQLCERMFFGRQDFGIESLTLPHDNEHIDKSIYFYYTIGLINEAHHLAYESMVRFGYRPENIKFLIKTNLINGHYKIAERYIKVLKRTLHYKSWAEKYEKMLYDPIMITSDTELWERIRLLPEKDFFIRSNDVQNIELFLIANPDNKRAFEYKMARLLLEKDFETLIYEIRKMKDMGYSYIPRHIEEAVVEYIYVYKKHPDLGGLIVSSETEMRFVQYNSFNDPGNKGNKKWLEKEMEEKWGNTFWYYLQYK
jgi:hypothetical protein